MTKLAKLEAVRETAHVLFLSWDSGPLKDIGQMFRDLCDAIMMGDKPLPGSVIDPVELIGADRDHWKARSEAAEAKLEATSESRPTYWEGIQQTNSDGSMRRHIVKPWIGNTLRVEAGGNAVYLDATYTMWTDEAGNEWHIPSPFPNHVEECDWNVGRLREARDHWRNRAQTAEATLAELRKVLE